MKLPRKRDYPKSLNIGHEDYRILFVRKIGKSNRTLGLCDPTNHTLQIRCRQTPLETLKTLAHEVLHAIEDEYDIEIPHALIYILEQALVDFFIQNF